MEWLEQLNNCVYVPFAKAKAGERDGFKRLSSAASRVIVPLFDVSQPTSSSGRSLGAHIETSANNIYASIGQEGICYIDTFDIPLHLRVSGNVHPVTACHHALLRRGVRAIPTYGFDRDSDYTQAVKHLPQLKQTGICLRLEDIDLEFPEDIPLKVRSASDLLAVPTHMIDVVIDYRSVSEKKTGFLRTLTLEALTSLSSNRRIRSITVTGSNIPRDVSGVPRDGTGYIQRKEYVLWRDVSLAVRKTVPIRFGDYGAVHPEFVDLGPIPNANAKIRYTIRDAWKVERRHMLRAEPKYAQYFELSRRVVQGAEYAGEGFSYGDRYIQRCARKEVGSGNLQTWVGVDTNHHVEYVAAEVLREIATLSLPFAAYSY
jgi:hypothetical protein